MVMDVIQSAARWHNPHMDSEPSGTVDASTWFIHPCTLDGSREHQIVTLQLIANECLAIGIYSILKHFGN